jgi:hypothetical protein
MLMNKFFRKLILTPQCWWNFIAKRISFIPPPVLDILTQIVILRIHNVCIWYPCYDNDDSGNSDFLNITFNTIIEQSCKTLQYIYVDNPTIIFKVSKCHKLKICYGNAKFITKTTNPVLTRIIDNKYFQQYKYRSPIGYFGTRNPYIKHIDISNPLYLFDCKKTDKIYQSCEVSTWNTLPYLPINCQVALIHKSSSIRKITDDYAVQRYDDKCYEIYGDGTLKDVCYIYYLDKKEVYRRSIL